MNSTNPIERSWWRRLARRTRAEAPRTNRLSHFEPLEQRTVLSASVFMPGGGDFFQTSHDVYRYDNGGPGSGYSAIYDVAPRREEFGGEDSGPESREEYADRDPLYAPRSQEVSVDGMPRALPVEGRLAPAYGPSGEGESATASSMLVSSAPSFGSPSQTGYKVEI